MDSKSASNSNEIRQAAELYLSQWKWLLLCLVIALALGFTYLRYAANEYSASATIKIQDEQESNKLPSIEEVTNSGLFAEGTNKIKDEIAIIKSKTLIENVVRGLDLNIKYYAEGKVKEREIYRNPPLAINFFESDSVIDHVNTNIYIKVKSETEFLWFEDEGNGFIDRDELTGTRYLFGDKINTFFGDIVITPNIGKFAPIKDSNYKIEIISIDRLVDSYQNRIMAGSEAGSSIVYLDLNDSNSHKAVDVLNRLIAEYNNDVLTDKEEVVRVTSEFINNRLQEVQEELGAVESTAELIQQRSNSTDLNAQTSLNLQAQKQIEQQINTTSTNISMISYLEEELADENKISDMLPADIGIGDAGTGQLIKSHNELVARRDALLRNSTEKNPVVVQLNNQISALKVNLQNSLASMKKTSELTLSSLNTERSRVSGQLYVAPAKARQLRGVTRQQEIKESLFLYLLEKREESAIRYGMYTPSAKIVDAASSSHIPVAPNTLIVYLASILFGLGLPIGIIYVSDLLNTKIYTKEDLVSLINIPYLGDVPKTSKKERLVKKVDYSPKAEAFRIIRSNIDFMLNDVEGRAKKLFITSTKAQEGKSHTSTNLATSISYSEKKVLLIELDIRVPKILKYLGIKDKPTIGLSDYIADNSIKLQDIIVSQKENRFLDIIPSGTIPPNPSELLMSDRLEQMFSQLEKKYDYIIADTSAVGLVSDTLLVSKFADMFIYVVSADGVDRRRLANIAQTLYNEKRLPNMTMLLNSVKPGKKGYGYGYGYGNNPNRKKKWFKKA